MKRLFIRTEANVATATGHMRRCLNIAEAARDAGAEVSFIVAEEESVGMPLKQGFSVKPLYRRFDDFGGEAPVLEEYFRLKGADRDSAVLLIDSYFVTEDYMREVRRLLPTAYIDDLQERIWPCDTLICYGAYASGDDLKKAYPGVKLCLGETYMPLNPIFRDLPAREIRQELREVLVLSGGTDPVHFLPQFLELIAAEGEHWKDLHFTLIAGALDPDRKSLKKRAETLENVTVGDPLPDLREALLAADLVITAAGTTLYELAATGTPGICYTLADNQMPNAASFTERGLFLFGGHIHRDGFDGDRLAEGIERMRTDAALRREMSRKLQQLTDGRGAERIARVLLD